MFDDAITMLDQTMVTIVPKIQCMHGCNMVKQP